MIVYAMMYAAAVGVPVLLAAWALAAVLREYGKPERAVWLAGLVLAFVLPAVGLLGGGVAEPLALGGAGRGTPRGVIGLPEIVVVPEASSGGWLMEAIVALWLVVSLVLAVRLTLAALSLARVGRSWRARTMDGVPVWMTDGIGPAVSGLLRPRVLVPSWLEEMPAHRRSLVLLHEQEHIRARDPWLMLLSRLAPIAAPWNPVVWVLSARLLRAIELDCDRRVLRHCPDVRTYGTTLIEISERDRNRLVAVAAFAESAAPLRSRILNMTTPSQAVSLAALFTSLVFGVVLMVAAFEIPVPTIRAEFSFGPREVAPVLSGPVEEDRVGEAQEEQAEIVESVSQAGPAAGLAGADAELARRAAELARRAREFEERAAEIAALQEAAERVIAGRRASLEEGRIATALIETRVTTSPEVQRIISEADAALAQTEYAANPTFTPFTVAPQLLNLSEVQRALMREFPTVLRDSGIGGTVTVWFFIDENGRVQQNRVDQSSGYEALDQAALNVASVYRFSPALNRESRTAVWVSLPITFQVR